ncbi:hypothetical protein, partial [Candidatus Poriferisocius sp.]|uniref:hypothetical protein n=1 Tax=Candidatus Poriferisocius sp. TaxID=3101276 RepID=UPI003B029099
MVAFTPFSTRHAAVIDETVLRILGQEAWPMPRTDADYDVNTDVLPGVYIYGASHTNGPVGSGIFMQKIAMFEGTTFEAGGETSHRMAWAVTEDQRRFYRYTTTGSWAGIPWIAEQPAISDATKTYTASELPGLNDRTLQVTGDSASTITLPAPTSGTNFRCVVMNAKTGDQNVTIVGNRRGVATTHQLTLENSGEQAFVVWDEPQFRIYRMRSGGLSGQSPGSTTFTGLTDTFNSFEGRANQFLLVDATENTVGSVATIPLASLPTIPASKISGFLDHSDVEILTETTTLDAAQARAYHGKFVWYIGSANGRLNLPTSGLTSSDKIDFVAMNLSDGNPASIFSVADGLRNHDINDRRTALQVVWSGTDWSWYTMASPQTHHFFELFDTPSEAGENKMLLGTAWETLEWQDAGTVEDLRKGDPDALPRHYAPKAIHDYVAEAVDPPYYSRVSNPKGLKVAELDDLEQTLDNASWTIGPRPEITAHYSLSSVRSRIELGMTPRAPEVLGFKVVGSVNGVAFDETNVLFGPESWRNIQVNFNDAKTSKVTLHYNDNDQLSVLNSAIPDAAGLKLEIFEIVSPSAGGGFEQIFCRYKSRDLPVSLYPQDSWGFRDAHLYDEQIYQRFHFTAAKSAFKANNTADLIIAPQGRDRPALNDGFGEGLFFWEFSIHDSGANRGIATLYVSSAQNTADRSQSASLIDSFGQYGRVEIYWENRFLSIPFHGDTQTPYTASPQSTTQRDLIFEFLDAVDAAEGNLAFVVDIILPYPDNFTWQHGVPAPTEAEPNIHTALRPVYGIPNEGDKLDRGWFTPAFIGNSGFTNETLYARHHLDTLDGRFVPLTTIGHLKDEDLDVQYQEVITFGAEHVSKSGDNFGIAINSRQGQEFKRNSRILEAGYLMDFDVDVSDGKRQVQIRLSASNEDTAGNRWDDPGPRFTEEFEKFGEIAIRSHDAEYVLRMNGANVEPYAIDVPNGADLLNFYHQANPYYPLELRFRFKFPDNFAWQRWKPSLTVNEPYGFEISRRYPIGLAPGETIDEFWGQIRLTNSLGAARGAYVDAYADYNVYVPLDSETGITELHDASGNFMGWWGDSTDLLVTISDIHINLANARLRWQYQNLEGVWSNIYKNGNENFILHPFNTYSYRFQQGVFGSLTRDKLKLRLIAVSPDDEILTENFPSGSVTITIDYQTDSHSKVI